MGSKRTSPFHDKQGLCQPLIIIVENPNKKMVVKGNNIQQNPPVDKTKPTKKNSAQDPCGCEIKGTIFWIQVHFYFLPAIWMQLANENQKSSGKKNVWQINHTKLKNPIILDFP